MMEVDDNQENDISQRRNPQRRKTFYRNLLDKIEAIQEAENVGLHTATEVGEILREVNVLNTEVEIEDRVENTDETLLDCLVLSSASGVLKRCINAVDVFTSTYDAAEFAAKARSTLQQDDDDDENINITRILGEARHIIRKTVSYNFVYGSYDLNQLPVPKQKKERQKVVKETLRKKEPEKVTNANNEEEGIEQIVKMLEGVLKEAYVRNQERAINYYDYIIDTDSYSNTIENMFYFAFLIRDGRAHIELDKKGSPVIKPMAKKKLSEFRNDGGKNSQIISCITMDIWEKYRKQGMLQQKRKSLSS